MNPKDYTLVEETVTVDGVAYDAEKIKTLVLERHAMAHEITALRTRLSRADRHLRLRTAALVRAIAGREEKPAQGVGVESVDREPQPSDGPDFHAEHAAWAARQATRVAHDNHVPTDHNWRMFCALTGEAE